MGDLIRKKPRNALTHEQRMAALGRANERRTHGKELRALLRAKDVDAIALARGDLAPFEPIIAEWKVERFLRALPGIGANRAFVVISHLDGVRPSMRIKELSWEQRAAMAGLVHDARMLRL